MNTTPLPPAPQPSDPRRRLRELLSIPERDRTEEQWDEIVELEIQMAPGNRIGATGVPTGKSGGNSGGVPGNGPQQPRKHRPKNANPRRPTSTPSSNNPPPNNKPSKPPRDPA